jgi:hypothetical protein
MEIKCYSLRVNYSKLARLTPWQADEKKENIMLEQHLPTRHTISCIWAGHMSKNNQINGM